MFQGDLNAVYIPEYLNIRNLPENFQNPNKNSNLTFNYDPRLETSSLFFSESR